jgi:hypothetical protein
MELKKEHLDNFIKIFLSIMFIAILYNILFRDNTGWEKEEYERCIATELHRGIVKNKFLNRGGTAQITLHKRKPHESIWVYHNNKVYDIIQKGDSLIKYPNSDKIQLFRNDSVIKLSNYGSNTLKQLYNYDSWANNEMNKWEKRKASNQNKQLN